MPLKKGKKNVGANIKELQADNKKTGKEKGANGKPRSKEQIKAIALNAALGEKGKKKGKKKKVAKVPMDPKNPYARARMGIA